MVKSLLQAKLKDDGLSKLCAFHLKKYRGKSGQEHEIDVSFEVALGELDLLILVECKEYARKVGVEDIMTFSYRMQDIGAHKGLIVTTTGFQEGAVKIAKAQRIGLLVAVKGKIVSSWAGFRAAYFESFIHGIQMKASDDGRSIQMTGKRAVTCNAIVGVERLREPTSTEEVMFLLPDEVEIAFLAMEAHQTSVSPWRRQALNRELEWHWDSGRMILDKEDEPELL